MFKKAYYRFVGASSIFVSVLLVILIILIALGVSFLTFSLGYWLITLILAWFFNVILPFTWWYSLGAWLIVLIVTAFIFPGLKVITTSNE